MTDAVGRTAVRPSDGVRRMRLRLSTVLGLVAGCAAALSAYTRYRGSQTGWVRAGGMIGWSQSAIESRLGPPTEAAQVELPDAEGRTIRPAPPGPYLTLIFRTFDGTFVVWLSERNGSYSCFRSKWAERSMYY
jgi:hypothetical protein